MQLGDLLTQLDGVRKSGRGWVARCPAHADQTPSLSIHEGDAGLLVKCWAGCTAEETVTALGLRMADLFYDSTPSPEERRLTSRQPKLPQFNWRDYAEGLQLEADDLWLRGTGVLEHARNLDISCWTDEDLDEAMEAVSRAHTDLARAECFNRLAVEVRAWGLKKENDRES
jgi:hypothetical protein